MDTAFKTTLWGQLGAAIDMLENAIEACPDDVWSDSSKRPEWLKNNVVGFWYLVYHTLFFLDYDLSNDPDGFRPPAPFNLDELAPEGLLPENPYTKAELRTYLEHVRRKCRATIQALDEVKAIQSKVLTLRHTNALEMLLGNLRHVQHHTAQLNLILRQRVGVGSKWVSKTATELA